MTYLWPWLALGGAVWMLTSRTAHAAVKWRDYLATLNVVEVASQVSFCKALGQLSATDLRFIKAESFPSWVARQRAAGWAILVDSRIETGNLDRPTHVYAVPPSQVASLTQNGHFLLY